MNMGYSNVFVYACARAYACMRVRVQCVSFSSSQVTIALFIAKNSVNMTEG